MSIITRFDQDEFDRTHRIAQDLERLKNIKELYTAKIVLATLMTYEYEEYLELLEKVIKGYTETLKGRTQLYEKISEQDITKLYNTIHRIANEKIL
jgi:hypothetical protein